LDIIFRGGKLPQEPAASRDFDSFYPAGTACATGKLEPANPEEAK